MPPPTTTGSIVLDPTLRDIVYHQWATPGSSMKLFEALLHLHFL
jgi:hypothetical protein